MTEEEDENKKERYWDDFDGAYAVLMCRLQRE